MDKYWTAVAGFVVVGVGVCIGAYLWLRPEVETQENPPNKPIEKPILKSEQNAQVIPKPTKRIILPTSQEQTQERPNPPEEIIIPQEQKLKFSFMAVKNGEELLERNDIDNVINDLKLLKEKCTVSSYTIKITCPKTIIPEKKLRSFLSRETLYIFTRRVMMADDLFDVLRDPQFAPTPFDQVHLRGNTLLCAKDGRWQIEIRGLNNNIEEMEIVAKDIIYALENPTKIIDFAGFNGVHPQGKISGLNQTQEKLVSRVLWYMTCDGSKYKAFQQSDNWTAFLPFVDFSEAPNIQPAQAKLLKKKNKQYIEDLRTNVISSINSDAKVDLATINLIFDNTEEWLYSGFSAWVNDVDLATLIRQTFFKL